jgi:hypothetical protein
MGNKPYRGPDETFSITAYLEAVEKDPYYDINRIINYLKDRPGVWVSAEDLVFELKMFLMKDSPGEKQAIKNIQNLCKAISKRKEFGIERDNHNYRYVGTEVTMAKKNPLTGGSYHPSCHNRLIAYHGVSAHGERYFPGSDVIASDMAFHDIWKDGAIYSSEERCHRIGVNTGRSCLFTSDRLAGDGKYVFLTLCKPHGIGSDGYYLAFDAINLVQNGAIVGIEDLNFIYRHIIHDVDPYIDNYRFDEKPTWTRDMISEYTEKVTFVQEVLRLRGRSAKEYLEWISGERKKHPLTEAEIRWVHKELGHHMHSAGRLVKDREIAASRAEILVDTELPLDLLIGVVFRKKWYEIDDFATAYGMVGTDSKIVMDRTSGYAADNDTGYPNRCRRCGGLVWLPPFETKSQGIWDNTVYRGRMKSKNTGWLGSVMVCKSCGAVFSSDNSDSHYAEEKDNYLGQIDDFEYVWEWGDK